MTKYDKAVNKWGKKDVGLVLRYSGDYMRHENCHHLFETLIGKDARLVPFNKFADIAGYFGVGFYKGRLVSWKGGK